MTEASATTGSWSGIQATLTVSISHSALFFLFFLYQRSKQKSKNDFSMYEPRQYSLHTKDRSLAPYSDHWLQDAWNIPQDQLLDMVGLDTFMYLRFLRLGMRVAGAGVLFSFVLIPLYATARNAESRGFNQLTLGRVEEGSNRLWITTLSWWIFVNCILYELWCEWKLFRQWKLRFLHHPSKATKESRLAARVECLDDSITTNRELTKKFQAMFPMRVHEANVFLDVEELEKAIVERQLAIEQVEKATAISIAKPNKPRPQTRLRSKLPCRGEKVDTMDHYSAEIERLNNKIDSMRGDILNDHKAAEKSVNTEYIAAFEGTLNQNYKPASSGVVVFTSLVAKESAIRCEYKEMKLFAAAAPQVTLWENATVPLKKQRLATKLAAAVWTVGILFWAVPVALATAFANLNAILRCLPLTDEINPNTAFYGFVAGLLPVIAMKILMSLLYSSIVKAATSWIRLKSSPEVNSYALYWHMLFQFANLWLILIGGSFFNRLDALVDDPASIINVIAHAMPGSSIFFVNMITVGGLGSFGLELSLLPQYGTALLDQLLLPEAQRTQRMLDKGKKPPAIEWGLQLPQHVFVFLVMIMYQPIVPLMELFAFVYFGGCYIVWKHQCVHVYAQSSEGGGKTTWESLFGFLMACLYMSEMVFVAYMGIKKGPGQAACGCVPLAATIWFHVNVHLSLVIPSKSLPLDIAQEIDAQTGELDPLVTGPIQEMAYVQPCLNSNVDERKPMPYRRQTPLE